MLRASKPTSIANSSTDKPPTRRAKIICTIGPACNTETAMRELLRLGMAVEAVLGPLPPPTFRNG